MSQDSPSEAPLHNAAEDEPKLVPPKDAPPEEVTPVVAVPRVSVAESDQEVERQMRRMSRRSFLWGGAAVVTGFLGWRWLIHQRDLEGIPWPLRVGLEIDENLARDYYRSGRLAPTFKREQAQEPKPNGDIGLSDDFDPDSWKLRVIGLADTSQATMKPMPVVTLTLDDIKKLHREDIVTELKCIEGWSVIVHWAGVRFADFVAHYPPADTDDGPPTYVGIETPDGEYYVGLDMESATHPQTLLCYEMNGQPLTPEHGAPLRLVIPVKYGIKSIKRIGTIRFTSERPKDYWAEQGYDWYAGH